MGETTTVTVDKDVYDRFGDAIEERFGRRYGQIKEQAERAIQDRIAVLQEEAAGSSEGSAPGPAASSPSTQEVSS